MATSPQTQQPQEEGEGEEEVVEMISCSDCGHLVPERNLMIHKAHACRGRARPTYACRGRARPTSTPPTNTTCGGDSPQSVVDLNTTPSPPSRNNNRKRHDNDQTDPRKRRTGQLKRDDDEDYVDDYIEEGDEDAMEVDEDDEEEEISNSNDSTHNSSNHNEVVNLLDDDDEEDVDEEKKMAAEEEEDEWACQRCTLLNPQRVRRCEACNLPRNSSSSAMNDGDDDDVQVERVRPADPTRRQRLIGGDSDEDDEDFSSPLGMVSGGALLGGLMGAAGAYFRGRPMGSSALEGAFSGGIAGGLANEFLSASPQRNTATSRRRRQTQQRQREDDATNSPLSQARSAGANGQPAYPVMNGNGERRNSTRQPRPSFRVVTHTNNNGYTTTIVQSSGTAGSTRIVRRAGEPERDPLMSYMLHSMMNEGGLPPSFARPMHMARHRQYPNIDQMSYEQLLAAFGDGTENLRASEEIISSLPTHRVTLKAGTNEVDLPKDAQQCSICLEDFEEGQVRKTLPCLHGMHEDCIDKWLRTNGACPVCKFNVKQNGDDGGDSDGNGNGNGHYAFY